MEESCSTLKLIEILAKKIESESLKLKSDKYSSSSVNKGLLKPFASANTLLDYPKEYFANYAENFIEFTYKNPTIYHVVSTFAEKLESTGYSYIAESKLWDELQPGKYFTKRNGSALVAFVVGEEWSPEKGVGAIVSHIDSLTVPLKPNSTKSNVDGYELLGVAPYADTLNELWWDRDLGIGGRIFVKDSSTGAITQKLVNSSPHPIARIPTLAPHFGAPAVGPFNTETQAIPVIGFSGSENEENSPSEEEKKSPLYGKHPIKLLRYVAALACVKVSEIVQWELQLFDVQKGTKGGLNSEFIFSPRVDDRVCSFAAIHSLLESDDNGFLSNDLFSIVGLFDNEEIGSGSRAGVKGGLFELTVTRVAASSYFNPNASEILALLKLTWANSIILSADVNHLVNPNFTNEYLENHKPVPNKGITIALDPNGHFATEGTGLALIESIARANGDELQYFQVRNDARSGSSIGPLINFQTGARTIDLGIAQLSMHSIRATLGSKDVGLGVKFFNGFFQRWRKTYDTLSDL